MKIAKWVEQTDRSIAWAIGDRTLGRVYSDGGRWRTTWRGELDGGCAMLSDDFSTAHDACLAAEKHWPPSWRQFSGWLESKNGGYFRKFGGRRVVYVRRAAEGWYAVQADGKLLGNSGKVSWFKTAVDACAAVEKELYTPVDADPFVSSREYWHWIKPKMRAA
jgi:hypothetical protein